MAMITLRNQYHAELEDLYDAEQQIVKALPKLQAAAKSSDLKKAFDKHLDRTKIHLERLDLLFSRLDLSRPTRTSSGMEGVIREGEKRLQRGGDADALDAALIAAAQHVEHYEMAGYGCARTFARLIGDEVGADLLQQTLDEEGAADKELTAIAMSGINQAARAGESYEPQLYSRLRYIDLDDLDTARYTWAQYKVRNRAGDELGSVDGVIVDSAGRPYYLVIDSRGLFVGNRYVVPVGKVSLDRTGAALTIDMDKDTLKRYPEFHSGAFASMDDEEARRYEWRVLEAIDPKAAREASGRLEYDRYNYYRQPEWLGTDWPARGRTTRAARADEPLAVGTAGESGRRPAADFDENDDPLKRKTRR